MRLRQKWFAALAGTAALASVAGLAPARGADAPAAPGAAEGHPAVKEMQDRGVLRGYPMGRFEPDRPVTRLELAVILARVIRAIESNPHADQPAKPPKQPAKLSPLPAGVPAWARGDFTFVAKRGYLKALPQMGRDLKAPVRQKDVKDALVWALAAVAETGFIPPGDLTPPPPEPKVE